MAAHRGIPERELAWQFFKAGGPGGQHRNKVSTAVRLTHLPTGITVSATERRSQTQNREVALARLRQRLAAMRKTKKTRRPTKPSRSARQKRLQSKKARGRIKKLRGPVRGDD